MQFNRMNLLALTSLCLFGCEQGSEYKRITLPDSPDGTLKVIASSIVKNQPQVLWSALPKSYQNDLLRVIHAYADKLDTEHYDKAFDLMKRITRLLKEKQSFIFGHPMARMMDREGKVAANWDSVIGIFDTLVSSEISSLSSLRQLDPEKFLATTGRQLLRDIRALAASAPKNPLNALANMQVEIVKIDGDRCSLKITAPDKPSKTDTYVKVGGRWLPEELVSDWPEMMKKADAAIAALGKDQSMHKMKIVMGLKMVETVLDQFEKIDDQDAFNSLMSSLMGR